MATLPEIKPLSAQVTDENIQKLLKANPGMTIAQAKVILSTVDMSGAQLPFQTDPKIQQALLNNAYQKAGVQPYMPTFNAPENPVVAGMKASFDAAGPRQEPKPAAIPTQEAQPIVPVKGTNENGEPTITFTAQGMKRFLTLLNPAQDGRLSGIDPNSNIGINPYAMKAPLTPEQAAQTDPAKNLLINANATPLPEDVLAQLRMDKQQQQQAGSYQPASLLAR